MNIFIEDLFESIEFLTNKNFEKVTNEKETSLIERLRLRDVSFYSSENSLFLLGNCDMFITALQNVIRSGRSVGKVIHLPDINYFLIEISDIKKKLDLT